MEGKKNLPARLWGHFTTVGYHKWLVFCNCARIGLVWQGITHDLSKYSPAEFIPGVRYFQGNRSPNDAQRQAEGCSTAWLHHKGRNRHHLEYWIDYDPAGSGQMVGNRIPLRLVAEMFCDRIAASKVYMKERYTDASPWEYYQRGKGHYILHPESREQLEWMLKLLKEQGEQRAFAAIRQRLSQER
ncbi:DUF5662 family protein [uncultured Allofournierella sp.]|uniref:DUF5662 family protein n=1 Tax=uncultured Allofournierella sp. TaxID=1940258 RepID=UPI003750B6DB